MLNHGFVKLVDSMPRENLDAAIVEAARVSYKKPGKSTDAGLIRHLMRHWHTTPFEMVEFGMLISKLAGLWVFESTWMSWEE